MPLWLSVVLVAVAMLGTPVQAAAKEHKVCPASCGPFGECTPCAETDNCVGERCRCADNYAGEDCSLQIEYCPGSVDVEETVSTCLNGGRCVSKEIMEGPMGFEFGPGSEIWRCDCTYAVGSASDPEQHAGTQCEFPSTRSCFVGGAPSNYAFCVNGGDCVREIIRGDEHPGCTNCPGFEGRHCQYLKGTAPPEELAAARQEVEDDNNGMKPGFIVLFVLLGGLVLGGLALMVLRQRQSPDERDFTVRGSDVPTDLKLDEGAEGETTPTSHEQDDDGEHKDERPQVV